MNRWSRGGTGPRSPWRRTAPRVAGRSRVVPAALLAFIGGVAGVPTAPATSPALAQEAGAVAPADTTVDALLDRGLLQEAAWMARLVGDTARADTILARLDSILRSAPREARPLSMDSQGVSYTWRLDYGGGVEAVFKVDGSDIFCRECGADREVGAYRVDRLLGFDLTPMTVPARVATSRDTLVGSAMYFIHGASAPGEVGSKKHDALRLFDAIIGNSDRHKANWLVLPGGRIVAIDHNRAFQYQPPATPKTCWETEVDGITAPGRLGAPLDRYRDLTADAIKAAFDGVDPALAERFVAMRPRILARLDVRAGDPGASLPLRDCVF
jgi:hypothetical protein